MHPAPSHALLVAYWLADDAAVLSVPTREYFRSSGWTALHTLAGASSSSSSSISASTNATPSAPRRARIGSRVEEAERVCTREAFAARHDRCHECSAFSALQLFHLVFPHSSTSLQVDDSDEDLDSTNCGGLEQRRFGHHHAHIGTDSEAAAAYR